MAASERDNESFDLDDEFLGEAPADEGSDYDRLLDKVDKRVRTQPGKRGKAAWSRLEEVLADRRLEKDLRDVFEDDA
ncbi:MAG: hypothetical protein KF790_12550 [Steroidobacteraceae bacterium]|nr:hypothetical protein [Steroidobacteraceae bacterium]MCW5572553.1 hypothetical protein [Steroidobacteraceae bacterium]